MAMVSTMTTVVFGYGYSLNSLSLWIRLWFELGPWYQGVVALESSIFYQNTLKIARTLSFASILIMKA